jgi:hypothetical protein
MTDEPETAPTQPPSTPNPPEHPFRSAAVSIRACAPGNQLPDIDDLADRLERALYSDCIYDPDDSAALLTVQARTMDALFHSLLQLAMKPKWPNEDYLRLAIHAQRQSALTIDRLKRQHSREKAHDLRVSKEFDKRNEGQGKAE